MSHKIIENINLIENEIRLKNKESKIIAVSKTFSMESIKPLIDHGHIHFGENKVQEAVDKWAEIKKNFQNLKLHMIGKLQTNKVKNAVALFDYIHSLDSLKLAEKISSEQNKISKKIKLFIQVNIGAENQKSGIEVEQLKNFYEKCINDFDLDIIGLMCIPPITDNVQDYFIKMSDLNSSLNLSELSMGMSSDYLDAVNNGSTFVRIGSKIFGKRS
jgi:PLP dependent protein